MAASGGDAKLFARVGGSQNDKMIRSGLLSFALANDAFL